MVVLSGIPAYAKLFDQVREVENECPRILALQEGRDTTVSENTVIVVGMDFVYAKNMSKVSDLFNQ